MHIVLQYYYIGSSSSAVNLFQVKIDPTKYFENALSGLHISARKNLMKLRQPVDRMRSVTGAEFITVSPFVYACLFQDMAPISNSTKVLFSRVKAEAV